MTEKISSEYFEEFVFDIKHMCFCIYKSIAVIYFQVMNVRLILHLAYYIDVLYVFL